MIKVLHILDIAGVPSILSHFYNKYGNGSSDIIYHQKNNFSQNISKFYGGKSFSKFRELIKYGFLNSRNYDIIHIHGAEIIVPLFKITGKKIVLHYHGSDINEKNRSLSKKRIFCRSFADLIIYNGNNMEKNIITFRKIPKKFLPNPVDTEHFHPIENKRRGNLSFVSNNLDKKKTVEAIQNFGSTDIIDLDNLQTMYSFMPNMLSKYETYVDIKIMPWDYTLPDLSTTALQALSCGCKVYHNKKMIHSFPSEHNPVNVIKQLNSFYREILD